MGRYPNKAPIGYANLTAADGKKFIGIKQPEAGIVRWIFLQLAKNLYTITEIWRMAVNKGFLCSLSNFSKLIRNPVYCGLIPVRYTSGERDTVPGVHEPLISIQTYYEVQDIINTKRKVSNRREDLKAAFFLRGFLICPLCGRMLTGSFAKGLYPYYHCRNKCRARISAVLLNSNYERKLRQLVLSNGATELFNCILDDTDLNVNRDQYLRERKELLRQLSRQQSSLSKARRWLFIEDILKFDDYSEFKKEYLANFKCLKKELKENIDKVMSIDEQRQLNHGSEIDVFSGNANLDIADKKHLVQLFPPEHINLLTGDVSFKANPALSKILETKNVV